jgi:hypothetical protein
VLAVDVGGVAIPALKKSMVLAAFSFNPKNLFWKVTPVFA